MRQPRCTAPPAWPIARRSARCGAAPAQGDGLVGVAALVQVCATLPDNFIAFEYPTGDPDWWYDIVDGLPGPIVQDSYIDVWDTPGIGVTFNEKARGYLPDSDRDFFD